MGVIKGWRNDSAATTLQAVDQNPVPVACDSKGRLILSPGQTALVVDSPGRTVTVTANPTIDTGAYLANDCIGGLITFASAFRTGVLSGMIQNGILSDKNYKNKQVGVIFFNANPTASTLTDQAPVVIHANDQAKVVQLVTISNFYAFAASGFGLVTNLGISIVSATTSLFAAMFAIEGVTYTAAQDLNLSFTIIQD